MNDAPPRRLPWPTLALAALTAAALMACLLAAGYLYLPTLVSDRLPADQIRRLGFADFSGRVTRIGPYQAEAGPFFLGDADRPAIAAGSVLLDYSPSGLYRKTIRRIRISDVTVNLAVGPHGLTIPGLDPDAATAVDGQPPAEKTAADLGMTIEKIEIRSGMLILKWGATTYRTPFEADLRSEGADVAQLAADLYLYPGDQPVALAVHADWQARRVALRMDGTSLNLDRFADLFHRIPSLDATGRASVHASAVLRMAPPALADIALDLAWQQGRLVYGPVRLEPERTDAPAVIAASSDDAVHWQIRADGLRMLAPAPVTMHSLTAVLAMGQSARTATAEVAASVQPFAASCPPSMALTDRLPASLALEWSQAVGSGWKAELRSSPPEAPQSEIDASFGGVKVFGRAPRFTVAAQGSGPKGSLRWQANAGKIRASAAGAVIESPSMHADGDLRFNLQDAGLHWSGQARLRLTAPTISGNGLAGQLGDMALGLQFDQNPGSAPEVDGRLRVADGRLQHDASALQISGLRLDLPCRLPSGQRGAEGNFAVARVAHAGRDLGGIHGSLVQKPDAYLLSAVFRSAWFPDLVATVEGVVPIHGAGFPQATLAFKLPAHALPPDSDLGRLTPAASGLTLAGTVSAQGTAVLSSAGVRGNIDFALQDGLLRMPQRRLELAGIDMHLNFPELPRLRSGPAQTIRFARAAMGGIVVDGGSFDFQVESAQTLLVEKGRLAWCDGKVDVQALRIAPGGQTYQLSLYCQRLALSRILEQLGTVNAKGTGTVNGRIPITYSGGQIRFDDGFLFSTPGETGAIQLTGTEILTRGIPRDTPQFAQIELAREALKDYAYDWARLGLVSEGEDFIMRLQFDGKPVNPLPFVYSKEIGGFVRVETGARGSVFQGVGLDVNLRLPLNRLLQYKEIVNLME